MSTRSAIIAKTETGYAGIYCHFDGYPSGVGQKLFTHYQDPEKVAALIALGDISSLGRRVVPEGEHSYDSPEEDTTVAYGRDRGEKGTDAFSAPTLAEVEEYFNQAVNGYHYVYDGGWKLNGLDLANALQLAVIPGED